MKAPSRRAGRPITAGKEGEKATLGIRASASLKAALSAAAKLNGRSLSQEAEERLQLTFSDQQTIERALALGYGRQAAGLILAVMRAVRDTGPNAALFDSGIPESAADWMSSPDAFHQVEIAISEIVAKLRPRCDTDPSPTVGGMLLGERVARGILEALHNPERRGEIGDWAQPVRELLGNVTARIPADDRPVIVTSETGILAELSKKRGPSNAR